MKHCKHLLSLLIAVVMVFSLIPATAFASTETAEPAPEGSVTAYLSLSDDAGFLEDSQGEAVALRKLTVPYFDLANYGLENFYFQSDEYDAGSLKTENADPNVYTGKVTVLHMMIYATEVLRCNVAPEDAGQGYLKEQNLMEKYFNPSGTPGSLFLTKIWEMDLNLNYYVQHAFPLATAGIGSTMDQILLHDDDVVTLGHFGSYSFYTDSRAPFNHIEVNGTADTLTLDDTAEISLQVIHDGGGVSGDATTYNNIDYAVDVYAANADEKIAGAVTSWVKVGTTDETGKLTTQAQKLVDEVKSGNIILGIPGQMGKENPDSICCAPAAFHLTVNTTEPEEETYLGVNVGSDVPASFENDLWTQYDFKELTVGDSAAITPRRVPEGVVNTTANDLQMPHFNYEIISGDSVVLQGNDNLHQGVKAVKPGNTVVKITYNAFTHSNGNHVFPACDPINTQYVVFSVGGNNGITIEDNICDKSVETAPDGKILYRSYDTKYFATGETTDFPLTVKTTGAESLVVKCNGITVPESETADTYNLPLENRNNIIEMTATAADGTTRSFYRVLAARKININVVNTTNNGQPFQPDDTARVSFRGIKMPVYKLATIYNPQWHSGPNEWNGHQTTYATHVNYTMNGNIYRGECSQWDLATNNDFTVHFKEAGTYNFGQGFIDSTWWGSPLGTDKGQGEAGSPNLNAPTMHGQFSFMPDFSIEVGAGIPVETITVSPAEITLDMKATQQLKATLLPEDTTFTRLNWTTDAPAIATVNGNGLVTAVKAGTANITVSVIGQPDKTATCKVTVNTSKRESVMNRIDELPHPLDVDLPQLQDVLATANDINREYESLTAEDKEQVTNYAHLKAVLDRCNQLNRTPYRFVTNDGHVCFIDTSKVVGRFRYDSFRNTWNVYELRVPAGTTSLTMEAYGRTPAITRFYGKNANTHDAHGFIPAMNNGGKNNALSGYLKNDFHRDLSNRNGERCWGTWFGFNIGNHGKGGTYFTIVVDNGNTVTDQRDNAAVQDVMDKINAIGTYDPMTPEKIDTIKAASNAYRNLCNDTLKKRVTNYQTLVDAEAAVAQYETDKKMAKAVQPVISAIEAIGTVENTEVCKQKIDAARTAYNKLEPEQQKYVHNYEVLTAAEEKLAQLQKDADDQAAAKAVDDKIAAIGDVSLQSETDIKAARDAYESLTEDQKALVKNLDVLTAAEEKLAQLQKDAEDQAAAKAVDDKIAAIGDVSLQSETDIKAARDAYESLTEDQKALVKNLDVLIAAEEKLAQLQKDADDQAAAKAVDDKIDAIGDVSLQSETDIKAARDAYESLTEDQKALVKNLDVLTAAEEKLAQLQKDADDQAAAKAVDDKIDAIGDVSLQSVVDIKVARDAYESLTEDQKALVENLDVLIAAEEKLAQLQKDADDQAANQAAAKAVDDKIAAIGDVSLQSETDIKAARDAYESLTEDQKALVKNLDVLIAAEEKLAQLQKDTDDQAANQAAAKAVDDKIAAIGNVSLQSETDIKAARDAYESLTEDQKALVKNLDVLIAAESTLAELHTQKPVTPSTGDSSNIAVCMLLMLTSAAAAVLVLRKKVI